MNLDISVVSSTAVNMVNFAWSSPALPLSSSLQSIQSLMQIQGKQQCQWNKPASFQSEGLGWSWKCIYRKLGCVRVHHDKSVFSYEAQQEDWGQERKVEKCAFLPFLGKQKQPNLLPECLGSDVYSGLARTNTGNLMSPCCIHWPPLCSLQMSSKFSRCVWTTNGMGRCEQRTRGEGVRFFARQVPK